MRFHPFGRRGSRTVALAAISLLIASVPVALAQLSPAAAQTGSQTYFLDSASSTVCSYFAMEYSTVPGASSVTIPALNDFAWCASAPAAINTDDITLVLWVSAPSSESASILADLQDSTHNNGVYPTASGTFTISGTSCSAPTEINMELTSSELSISSGDLLILSVSANSNGFTVCTGGHYATYMTVNPLEQTTTTVVLTPTKTTVSCSPADFAVSSQTTCTATVSNVPRSSTASAPTGTVAFSSSSPGGTFSAPSCTTTSGNTLKCTASYSSTSTARQTITAAYPGDPTHAASHGRTAVFVHS